ncbi:MAG: hypothetical protein K2L80_06060 [Muribaculaceae bacterium]|nr:hypothetical protein [Muribaculaceae bacterium]
MKKSKFLILTAVALVSASAFVSCDSTPDLSGSWTCAPQHLNNVNGAFTASSIDVFSFTNSADSKKSGSVVISSMVSAQQTVSGTPDLIEPYQETVAATASITGTWTFHPDEDDDVDIILDYSTLKVNIDPAGVAFSQNYITGREQPQIDSLTASAVSRWQQSIYEALKPYYSKYVRLDDISIKNNILRTEVNDTDLTFTRKSR